jgi:hypothetical protein
VPEREARRDGNMARRWVALAVVAAQAKFRRIKGHHDMPFSSPRSLFP